MLLYKIVDIIFQLLNLALLIRVLLSWVPHSEDHPLVYHIHRMTDPMLKPFQNLIPTWKFGIDVSPIFAFLALAIVKKIIFQILF